MPIVQVETWKGKAPEVKAALAEALTRAVVEHVGCSPEAVTVVIREVDKKDWYIGGKDAHQLFPTAT
ncbi:MAG TPA: tautomerase family protein [Holophaga sp.]|nr:tautomerase family protein [Holophaga sp.]